MSSHAATLKRGAILASMVVSSYALFGHDAWAPEPVVLTDDLVGPTGTSASAVGVNTGAPTSVIRWPGSWTWTSGAYPEAGLPCSPTGVLAGTIAIKTIVRWGNYAGCDTSVRQGAKTDAALSATGSTAAAKTLPADGSTGEDTTVVQFPASWTYNTTLAAETYCTTSSAPAGTVVFAIIVRSGNYAKCTY